MAKDIGYIHPTTVTRKKLLYTQPQPDGSEVRGYEAETDGQGSIEFEVVIPAKTLKLKRDSTRKTRISEAVEAALKPHLDDLAHSHSG